ncbi:MAG: methylmalonyl-CoA mutase, partial [Thermoplasmata archaeon]|nr:methylmalonyl-CoA mutase [Thermoplasmata archaeon]
QEDVDVIGLSLLSGAHMTLFPRVLDLLRENDAQDIMVTGGGIIPEKDAEKLKGLGMTQIWGPGTPTDEIVTFIKEKMEPGARS